jgi:hypothetical protein
MRAMSRIVLVSAVLLAPGSAPHDPPQREMRAVIGTRASTHAEILASTSALPAHIATGFSDPIAFTQTSAGQYLVFDRRAQAVYAIDRAGTEATRLVQIGEERGRIIRPTSFASEPGGTFVVVDQPGGRQRIQRFADRGYLLNGFTLAAQPGPRLVVEGFVLGGSPSLQFTGDAIFLSQPQTGSLITEYTWDGQVRRAFGALRATGHEADRALHLSLNAGLPLVDPTGGFCFVFQSGIPTFRRYDGAGALVFERHIEGRELDDALRNQPSTWPAREADDRAWPAVPSVIRAAAIDPHGNLWVALNDPIVYVYSPDGDKIRTLQLQGAGPLAPTSLFFAGGSRLLVTPGCYIFDVARIVP